ncbi:MAG: hypothetical protein K2Y18_08145 [Alphaproteobacteria bacterium]|jgi:hypothetical protein|nr:hypothetical protein [Alphaproteobacteria bacterium]
MVRSILLVPRFGVLGAFLSGFMACVQPIFAGPEGSLSHRGMDDIPEPMPQESTPLPPSPNPYNPQGNIRSVPVPVPVPVPVEQPIDTGKVRKRINSRERLPSRTRGEAAKSVSQKKDESWEKANKKKLTSKEEGSKKLKVISDQKNPPPKELRPLQKKMILLDARRLKDQKLAASIRYIKENPDMRFKVQNMTIDIKSIVSLMEVFKRANVLDQIRVVGFVMLPGANNQVLNENEFIEKVLPYLGYLEGIELSCLGVTDKLLKEFPKRIPHLKSLSLFGFGVNDDTILNLSTSFPNLTKLHLINTKVTNKGIRILVENFPYLKALGISGQDLKKEDFTLLAAGVGKLHSFSMIGQSFKKDMDIIKNLLSAMPKLHTLDLSETDVSDDVAKSLGNLVNKLKVLDISETRITRSGLRAIVENLDLTTLKINNLKGIGKTELLMIADTQPGLRKFYFSGAYFDDPTIMHLILKLPKLMDLTLIPNGESGWIMSEAVAEACCLKKTKLQYLHVQAKRLPEVLRLKLETDLPNLRVEYET